MIDWQPIETAPKDGTVIIVTDSTKELFCFSHCAWEYGFLDFVPAYALSYDSVEIDFEPEFWTTTDFLKASSPT